jgi:hypothetical protein
MDGQKTREFGHGPNIQLKRQGSWNVTSLENYVQVAEIREETKDHVRTVSETIVTFLTTTQGEGGNEYYPFKESFFENASPGLTTRWNADFSTNMDGIEIEIGTMMTLDKYFMDEYIKDYALYCFQLDISLFEAHVESWPNHTVKLGWKKYGM